jgi:hypothetical protein
VNDHKHYPRTWKAVHVNGWETWIAENESGDFVVWVSPAGQNAVVDCVGATLQHAQDAALLALAEHTGHHCAADCGRWGPTRHTHEDDRSRSLHTLPMT